MPPYSTHWESCLVFSPFCSSLSLFSLILSLIPFTYSLPICPNNLCIMGFRLKQKLLTKVIFYGCSVWLVLVSLTCLLFFIAFTLILYRLCVSAANTEIEWTNKQSLDAVLFHRLTRTAYHYNGCLPWYNVVLTSRVHSSVKYSQQSQLRSRATVEEVC